MVASAGAAEAGQTATEGGNVTDVATAGTASADNAEDESTEESEVMRDDIHEFDPNDEESDSGDMESSDFTAPDSEDESTRATPSDSDESDEDIAEEETKGAEAEEVSGGGENNEDDEVYIDPIARMKALLRQTREVENEVNSESACTEECVKHAVKLKDELELAMGEETDDAIAQIIQRIEGLYTSVNASIEETKTDAIFVFREGPGAVAFVRQSIRCLYSHTPQTLHSDKDNRSWRLSPP